jgi:hypothetical protein
MNGKDMQIFARKNLYAPSVYHHYHQGGGQ